MYQTCEAGVRIKPGVSEALRAQPQDDCHKNFKLAKRATAFVFPLPCHPLRGLKTKSQFVDLGFARKASLTPGFMLTPASQVTNKGQDTEIAQRRV
jgi:hypothetical protein